MKQSELKLVINLLDIIALGAKLAPSVMASYRHSKALIERIIAENREPTVEEHEVLNQEIQELREALHGSR